MGGHGVYVGDEYAQWDTTWRSQTAATISTRDPNNGNIVAYNRIENYGVVYRDCLAVYAGHTRNLRCSKNEVSYGNYTGIAVGTFLAHKISPYWPQNSEGSRVSFNKVHHVMLKLSDGGGIYLQGSHLPSTSLAPTLAGNYIHDIVLNPFLNVGLDGSNGLYWDGGSDGWEVYNNFVERTQHGYHFSGVDRINDCKFGPADYKCGNPPVFAYGYPTWPKSWYHNTYGIVIPGQSWFPGIPNYWRDEPLGAYGSYAQCYGYGEAGVSGGMQELTGSLSANRTVTTATPYTLEVNAIKGGAGVTDAAIASRFFPLVVKRIHRAAICGGLPLDPASQVQ